MKLATSGITTAYASLSFAPGSTYGHMRSYDFTSEMIRAVVAARPNLLIDHRVHARFEVTFPAALSVVKELVGEGSVDLVSLCDHTPGQGQYRNLELQAANISKNKGISLEAAAEQLQQRIRDRGEAAGDMTATLRAITQYCALHGVPVASHDDDMVEKVELMDSLGANISEFPVTLEAAKEAISLPPTITPRPCCRPCWSSARPIPMACRAQQSSPRSIRPVRSASKIAAKSALASAPICSSPAIPASAASMPRSRAAASSIRTAWFQRVTRQSFE
jgi:hypothetical protein